MSSTIQKMDKILGVYYTSKGKEYYCDIDDQSIGITKKIGKFQYYCEQNGFDDSSLAGEFKEKADECSLIDFDGDPSNFPLNDNDAIANEQDQQQAVMKILKCIYEHGTLPQNVITSKFSIDLNIKPQNISDIIHKIYKIQLKCCLGGFNELDLLHFFAIGYANDIPLLTYLVDAFTIENSKRYFESNRKHIMTLSEWIQNNQFLKTLTISHPEIVQKLKMAMTAYTTRVMPRLTLAIPPTVLVKDNISQIVDYIVAVPRFIKALLGGERADSLAVSPPFCIDLLFAVQNVAVSQDKEIVDPDEKENVAYNPGIDQIANLQERLESNQCVCSCTQVTEKLHQIQSDSIQSDNDANEQLIDVKIARFSRFFKNCYDVFRTRLDQTQNKDGFDPKTYPNSKRFAIFVDRRKSKETHENDEITFFEQLKEYGTIPANHIAEWCMEAARGCLIPGTKEKKNTITSMDDVCGQLLTFSFNVEATDEIKCYIIWNQQTMLFKGENLADILSYIFMESKDIQMVRQRLSLFNETLIDKRFDVFSKQINNGYRPYVET